MSGGFLATVSHTSSGEANVAAETFVASELTVFLPFAPQPPQSSPRLNVEELQNMTPERRKSILTHEVGKRVRENSGVKREEMDSVVTALVGLDLGVVDALKDKALMGEKVSSPFYIER